VSSTRTSVAYLLLLLLLLLLFDLIDHLQGGLPLAFVPARPQRPSVVDFPSAVLPIAQPSVSATQPLVDYVHCLASTCCCPAREARSAAPSVLAVSTTQRSMVAE
jgi:hypothetical protein